MDESRMIRNLEKKILAILPTHGRRRGWISHHPQATSFMRRMDLMFDMGDEVPFSLEPISKLKNDSPKDIPYAKAETSRAIFPRILQFIHGAGDMPKLFPRR
jgi:hypothetical protein